MSSPIAKNRKTGLDDTLIAVHRRLSHDRRIAQLASHLVERLAALPLRPGADGLQVLDVGCGDMTLSDAIERGLPQARIRCTDIHPCSAELVQRDPRWQRYTAFDGIELPFAEDQFDVVILSDVLHHVPEDRRLPLLRSVRRVARRVIIKDHFEEGQWSRQVLRAMDFVGNFGYGVSVPRRYFRPADFESLCAEAGLRTQDLQRGIDLYAHLPLLRHFLSPQWQFIALCEADRH